MFLREVSYRAGGPAEDAKSVDGKPPSAICLECGAGLKEDSTLDVGGTVIGNALIDPGSVMKIEGSRELYGTSSILGED